MSLAKIERVAKARKDQGTCEVCGTALPAGSPYKHYSVGFRGFKRKRCVDCPDPKQSERESSKIAGVYAAQEEVDTSTITTIEDAKTVLSEFAEAVREVAQEYRDAADAVGAMGEEMEAAADTLESSADDVENTDLDEYAHDENGDEVGDDVTLEGSALDDLRTAVQEAVDGIELP